MKKYFICLLSCLFLFGFYHISRGNVPKPDPCETDQQPGCSGYDDPETTEPGSSITPGATAYTAGEPLIEKVDDGMWYMKVDLKNASKPLVIHTVRYTTTSAGYSIETRAGNDSIPGKESPASMINRYEQAGRQARMAINPDGSGSLCMMIGRELKNSITGGRWQRPVADGLDILK